MIQQDILAFIPQRPPFVMIDTVLGATDTVSQASFTIPEGYLFVENGRFTEPGIVEHMAQTAAAGTGYKASMEHKPAPVGFIGALKGLQIQRLPFVGETMNTTIQFVHQVLNAHIVQATTRIGEDTIATCELKIFLQTET